MELTTIPTVAGFLFLIIAAGCQGAEGDNSTEIRDYNRSVPGFKTDFSRMAIDPAEIMSGGPPKDGIPALCSIAESTIEFWISEPPGAYDTAI